MVMAAHEVENFYGCYLLYCTNPQYKGRTYIGFTVDPNRRINQHNTGKHAGGAWRTSGKGPWEMVLIVHGFPNHISALRFEWAWQHPESSRRLKHIPSKKKKENKFQFCLRVVCGMLNTKPWCRFALTFRWLNQNYAQDFPCGEGPPMHMPIAYGPVKSKKVKQRKVSKVAEINKGDEGDLILSQLSSQQKPKCYVCRERFKSKDDTMNCYHPECTMEAHTLCLSEKFLQGSDELIPLDGMCPRCRNSVLWGDLVRYKLGCYQDDGDSDQEGAHWTDEL